MDLLEQERLVVGQPEPLDVQRRRADLDPEGGRHGGAGRLAARATSRVPGSWPWSIISSAKLSEPAMSQPDRRSRHERPAAAGPLDPRLAGELPESAPDGDQAAAVALRQLAFGRQLVAGPPLARVQ